MHQTIKFTYDLSDMETTFLDTTVCKGTRFRSSNILDIRTHKTHEQATIRTRELVPPTRDQESHYLRTNSDKMNYNQITHALEKELIERSYNKETIREQINKVQFTTRHTDLQSREKTQTQCLCFITRYCDKIPEIRIIQKHWTLIMRNPILKTFLKTTQQWHTGKTNHYETY